MRIQHNIMAMNAYRNFSNNTSALSKNLEKLSSGYKINRAGDDAAGLAISEKMRAQITGLETAQKNAKDGISLIQTAEGALTEVHDMLNRMVELADQSANGTYDNETDRANLQKEFDALRTEIDRIADSSNFNGIKLLDGSLAEEAAKTDPAMNPDAPKAIVATGDVTVTTNAAVKHKFVTGAITAADSAGGKLAIEYMDADGSTKSVTLDLGASDNTAAIVSKINDDETLSKLFEASDSSNKLVLEAKIGGANAAHVTKVTASGGGALAIASSTSTDQVTGKDRSMSLSKFGTGSAINAGNTNIKTGTTLTIGDKTYEILSDVSKVKEGNTAVALGSDDGHTLENLVNALKANGVTSASLAKGANVNDTTADNTDATGIYIGDLSEITAAQQGNVTATSDAAGVLIENTVDTTGIYEFTAKAGSAAGDHTMTVEYLDENGAKQTKDIGYTLATGATAISNVGKAISKALKDSDLSGLFDIKDDGAGKVTLSAKTAGTDGARLIGIKNNETDQTTNGLGNITIAEEAKDAGLKMTVQSKDLQEGDTLTVDGKTYQFVKQPGDVKEGNIAVIIDTIGATDAAKSINTAKNLASALKSNGVEAAFDAATGAISIKNDTASATPPSKGLTLQIGDTAEDFNQMTVSINDMHTKALGLSDISIADQEDAKAADAVIRAAINSVSSTRGDLGALQNRLDHTINNLSVMQENIQDAESSIRDVDVANEMMAYTKNNILIQSAQAMLAQANQVPQGVLQLLQ